MTSEFYFKPSARLQRYLGRELIADPNLAILEFVKNAYDAGASNVYIHFHFPKSGESTLLIADDGEGMNEKTFEQNWMHPGYSEKSADSKESRSRRSGQGGTTARVPVGEKGLGRLAAGRLGSSLEVFTRRSVRQNWLHVSFDWAEFDNMYKLMDEVGIPFDDAAPSEPLVSRGTILVISDLSLNWSGRIVGRPQPGRSRTRLGRLKQDLELLVRPLAPTAAEFTIYLDSNSYLSPNDIGTITPTAAVTEADYVYSFSFSENARGTTIKRKLRRSKALISEFGGSGVTNFDPLRLEDVAEDEKRPHSLNCGPFEGQFLYSPAPAAKRAKEIDAIGSGVLLYRDGVLVEPYGLDENDWVGVSARKAQRQGYALIQPSLFSGHVQITREANPTLRDMSNRQGLLDGEESESFIQHVQAEFSFFESQVFDELKQRWESREEKAARQAEGQVDLASVRLRAIAHSLGQPLLGLDADLTAIRIVAKRPGVPHETSDKLVELADSAKEHLREAQQSLARFRDVPPTERSTVRIDQLVEKALQTVMTLARSLGVVVKVDAIPEREVLVHSELIGEAVSELARNAVEADRLDGCEARVWIRSHEVAGDFVLDIIDNGIGFRNASVDTDLSSIASTKGRPGMGLATVVEVVAASLGRVRIAETGPTGTRIELSLPDRIRGLRT